MKRHDVAAVSRPLPLRGFAGHRDLLAAVPRLVADHGPGASLARQAVAHSVARGFAFDREVKLPATAGGMSCHCSLRGGAKSRIPVRSPKSNRGHAAARSQGLIIERS